MQSFVHEPRASASPIPARLFRHFFLIAGIVAGATIQTVACAGPSIGSHYNTRTGIKCTLEQVKDTEKSGLMAFTYFVPEGWTAHHFMRWGDADSFVANISASTPDKNYSVDQLEPMLVTHMAMRAIAPRGLRITHATDFLHSLVDQIKLQYNLESVTVVEEFNKPLALTPAQETASNANWGPLQTRSPLHESGYLKIRFDYNGGEETAEMGTTVTGTNTRMHALNDDSVETSTSGVYAVGPTMVIIAPAEPTASKVKEVQLIASTMRATPQFLDYRAKLTTALAQAQMNANAAALKENDRTWHERSMASFRGQMAAKDANTHQFCNYLLDQQDYRTKGGSTVTLPSSYKHAWEDGNGHYLLTDDPSVDARGSGSGKWELLEKATLNN